MEIWEVSQSAGSSTSVPQAPASCVSSTYNLKETMGKLIINFHSLFICLFPISMAGTLDLRNDDEMKADDK